MSFSPPLSPPRRALRGVRAATLMARGYFVARNQSPSRGDPLAHWCRDLLSRLGVGIATSGGTIPQDSCLLVANHISWMDILVIRSLLPARFIAKSEVALWPLVGSSAREAGTFFIARNRLSSFRRTLDQVQGTLENNDSVAVFPEGTTTCGDRILPFRSGLFEAAVRTGRPVLPVALRYETPDRRRLNTISYTGGESFARSFWRTLGEPRIIVRVHILPFLVPTGLSRRDLSLKAWTDLRCVLFPPL